MSVSPKFAHVVLQTNRLPQMRDWYCTVLGARVVYGNEAVCFVTFDEEHHRVAFVSSPADPFTERTPLTVGLQHTAFTFPGIPELLTKFDELAAAGIEPVVPIQHGVTTSLYYRDPDGNNVELQVDNFAEPDDATDYMKSSEYTGDPVGPSFDPRRMADALAGGTPVEKLRTRSWAVAAGPPVANPMMALMGPA